MACTDPDDERTDRQVYKLAYSPEPIDVVEICLKILNGIDGDGREDFSGPRNPERHECQDSESNKATSVDTVFLRLLLLFDFGYEMVVSRSLPVSIAVDSPLERTWRWTARWAFVLVARGIMNLDRNVPRHVVLGLRTVD